MIGSRLFRRVTRTAADMRKEHGLLRAFGLFTLRSLARLTGGTVLACMHKPVGRVGECNARLLTRAEIERASTNAVARSAGGLRCVVSVGAVLRNRRRWGCPRRYAWTAVQSPFELCREPWSACRRIRPTCSRRSPIPRFAAGVFCASA